jgi:hypothetical protein
MILKLNIKATKIQGQSKSELMDRLHMYGYTVSSKYGSYYGSMNDRDEYILVANFQKVNKKTKQVKKNIKGKIKTVSTIIRRAHWIAYYYRIPKAWLEASGSKVEQRSRNFVIKNKK